MAKIIDLETEASFDLGSYKKPTLTLGRSKDPKYGNDIGLYPPDDDTHIADEAAYENKLLGVSKQHHITFIFRGKSGWHLTPKKDRGVFIGDEMTYTTDETRLENGMEIFLGVNKYGLEYELEFEDSAAQKVTDKPASPAKTAQTDK